MISSDTQEPCRLIVVAGMHRSGTSAVSGELARQGVNFGNALLGANEFNPKGYFEDQDAVAVNEDLMTAVYGHWSAPLLRAPERLAAVDHGPRNEIAACIRRLGAHRVAGLKDPRICRVAPLWEEIALAQGVEMVPLVVIRDPAEAAASLYRRDCIGPTWGACLWLLYLHDLIVWLAGRNRPFHLVSYEDCLANPEVLVRWVDDVDTRRAPVSTERCFLEPGMRHPPPAEFLADPVVGSAREVYSALHALTDGSVVAVSPAAARDLLPHLARTVMAAVAAVTPETVWRVASPELSARWVSLRANRRSEVADLWKRVGEAERDTRLLQTRAALRVLAERQSSTGLFSRGWLGLRRRMKEAGCRRSAMALLREFRTLRRSPLFDPAFYLSENPDVVGYPLPPELHYLLHGAREGRDPGPAFNTDFYLTANPDVAASGMNPLIHFIRSGYAEGRQGTSIPLENAPIPMPGNLHKSRRFFDRLSFTTRWTAVPLVRHAAATNSASLDIHWIIPDFQPGAGGHMTIFRMVRFLETFGHRQTLWINRPRVHASAQDAYKTIREHFQPIERLTVRFLPDGRLDGICGDALIATDRWTCYPARAMANFLRRFYFVQDHESDFYPAGSESLLTAETYRFGFDCLCAGEWLDGLMRDRYGQWSMKWDLAYDPSVYFPPEGEPPTAPRIAFYSRYATPRRAVELGLLALEELARRGVRFHVDLFGGRLPPMKLAFSCTEHGVLSADELGALYRQVRVGMVFSATNHSLIPREMMACGLPLVELDIEPVRAVFPPGTLELARPDPLAIANALERLLTDEMLWERRSRAGIDHTRGFSWERSARLIEGALLERLGAQENGT